MQFVRCVPRRSALVLGSLVAAGSLTACGRGRNRRRNDDRRDRRDNGRRDRRDGPAPEKPVLYLYPDRSRDLRVRLDYDGELTYCYPEPRREGASATWSVTAAPDGALTGVSGRVYPSLFWEGTAHDAFEQTEGFVVEPGEAASFLEDKLSVLGLSDREAAEFITYWGPRIEARGRVLLTFAADQIAAIARYTMTESGTGTAIVPDTFLRVYLLVGDVPASGVPEQVLATAPPRTGFTAVEWGGSEL